MNTLQRESMNHSYNGIHLNGILYQKGGLKFFDMIVSDHKQMFRQQTYYNVK